MEENLTPAERNAHADPTDATATVGADALEAAAGAADRASSGSRQYAPPAGTTPTLYIGNLYYEVTTDQIKRVFSRFGEVSDIKIIYDNRGLSRGYARSIGPHMAQTTYFV